jgi:transcriptional regulator with XRE-family HTH domain
MELFAKRLHERAKQLGISNAEAARRVGLDERRYAHYASGRREPDLETLITIAKRLGTTPNWLLGVTETLNQEPKRTELIDRLIIAASQMTMEELRIILVQSEAVSAMDLQNRASHSRSNRVGVV